MPSGPKRAPTQKVVSVSNGAPTTAASAFLSYCTFGRRAKVRTPEKRGLSKEFAGSYLTILPPPTFHLQEAFP